MSHAGHGVLNLNICARESQRFQILSARHAITDPSTHTPPGSAVNVPAAHRRYAPSASYRPTTPTRSLCQVSIEDCDDGAYSHLVETIMSLEVGATSKQSEIEMNVGRIIPTPFHAALLAQRDLEVGLAHLEVWRPPTSARYLHATPACQSDLQEKIRSEPGKERRYSGRMASFFLFVTSPRSCLRGFRADSRSA